MATLRRTVLVARMGSPFSATLASSLSQTRVLSNAENYRFEHGNFPEWQRKIPQKYLQTTGLTIMATNV